MQNTPRTVGKTPQHAGQRGDLFGGWSQPVSAECRAAGADPKSEIPGRNSFR